MPLAKDILSVLGLGLGAAPPQGGARIFFDTYGIRWEVQECVARRRDDEAERPCLVFTSKRAVRRVWNYPPNWRGLTSAQLVTVSWNN